MVDSYLNIKCYFYYLKISFLFLFLLSFHFCKENKSNSSLPKEAIYEKKTNSYSLITDGKKKVWNEKGQLFSEVELDEVQRENGNAKTYFPENGKLLSTGKYKNGEREGIWEWYFPNGNLYYRSGYSPDKKRQVWIATNVLGNEHGIHERYYENGQLEEKGSYEYGLKVGKWEKYYKNGKPEHYGSFKNDKKIGKWIYLYPDGKIVTEENFDENGKLINRSTFYPDGSPECMITEKEKKCL